MKPLNYNMFLQFIQELKPLSKFTPIETQLQFQILYGISFDMNYKNRVETEFIKWLEENKKFIVEKNIKVFEMNVNSENLIINNFLNNLKVIFQIIGEANQEIVWKYLQYFLSN